MAAINYMAKRGWVLDQTAYGVKGCEELQYIMKKMVKSDDEIMYGLNIYGSPLKPSTNNGNDTSDGGNGKWYLF